MTQDREMLAGQSDGASSVSGVSFGDPGSSADSRCLLFDGHGLLYRAFFALPVMTTADGRHTNALFGFIRMAQQWLRECRATHAAVAFDAGLPEKRLRLLESYKAQRPPMPTALREQIDYAKAYLDVAGIPSVAVEGQEADDVIATLVARLARDNYPEILIVSSDKDLYQLVSSRIALISPSAKSAPLDAVGVFDKTGVEPHQIVDWLALIGDSADNIPGVPGIGPKIAARLLREYGTLDTLWQNLDAVRPESVGNALRRHRDLVIRNVELMILRKDLDVEKPQTWDDLALRDSDHRALDAFFKQYELKSVAPEKPASAKPEQQGMLNLGG